MTARRSGWFDAGSASFCAGWGSSPSASACCSPSRSFWKGSPASLEGVTGLVGEGERLQAESPDQVQRRLSFVAGLWAASAVGWVLARVGTALREPGARPPIGPARLASEVLFLLGGVGLAVGVLTALSPRAAGYVPPEAYREVTPWGVAGGLAGLVAAWAVRRVWVRSGGLESEKETR